MANDPHGNRRTGRGLARLRTTLGAILLLMAAAAAPAATPALPLPPRAADAPTGTALCQALATLPLTEREDRLIAEVLAGNVPEFLRSPVPVEIAGVTNTPLRLRFYVAPDYLAVGADDDYFLAPLTPAAAQRIANALQCTLPTRKMVDLVYAAAPLKLPPRPLSPSPGMTTVAVFSNHNWIVRGQRTEQLPTYPLRTLVAGHKKDVVLAAGLARSRGKVAIYGWHRATNAPIQPLYLGHTNTWVDYSHGVRLVYQLAELGTEQILVPAVLTNRDLAVLLSDEGPLARIGYDFDVPGGRGGSVNAAPGGNSFRWLRVDPGVRALIDLGPSAPPQDAPTDALLVLYALPNGNSIEQTFGKQTAGGDDWRFNIQHIGAQTQWLRRALPGRRILVAYLEANTRSWPAWRKEHGNEAIPPVIEAVRSAAGAETLPLVLNGHSGGGSFIFGFLNAVPEIPADVVRIAFLDSNYAYDPALGHDRKIASWLRGGPERALGVLAYNDAIALLDGKPFVTAQGGTWGRSRAMLTNLGREFAFSEAEQGQLAVHTALDGRVQFLLHPNPDKKILHTVQVERNGFIHSLLFGTPSENRGYSYYFGPRVYDDLIQSEAPREP